MNQTQEGDERKSQKSNYALTLVSQSLDWNKGQKTLESVFLSKRGSQQNRCVGMLVRIKIMFEKGGGGGGSVAEEVESWIPSPASSRSMLNLPIYILGYRRTFWKAFNIETTKKVTLKEISL